MRFIRKMARQTDGMMPLEVYEHLYRLAKELDEGDILDLGVGQGATTIAYAHGLRKGGKLGKVVAVDQFFQHEAPRPHRHTLQTNPHDAVEWNVRVFEEHLQRFGVASRVEVLVGTTDEIDSNKIPSHRVRLLSIDVDGHIDRDLANYYDLIVSYGVIVIDDYKNSVDRNGRRQVAHWSGVPKEDVLRHAHSLERRKARRLLGKQLLTYRLANHLQALGILRLERVVGNSTAVFRKTSPARFADFDLSGIQEIELSIVEDFIAATQGTFTP